MLYTDYIDNKSILGIIRRSCSCVDPRLIGHGYRVAYLVSLFSKKRHSPEEQGLRDICFLSLLHDIGAYKTDEISRMLQFDTSNVFGHSVYGYLFIKYFSPLSPLSKAILYHHVPWNKLLQSDTAIAPDSETPSGIFDLAQMIQVADRIDVCMTVERKTWEEALAIIKKGRGTRFAPHIVEMAEASTLSGSIEEAAQSDSHFHHVLSDVPFTSNEISDYLSMLIFTIDFRSRHTVTHTITTTTIGYELAKRLGFDETERSQIVCGSLLHDLGKIGIPVEILEYHGKLSPQAMNIMRTHVNITEAIFAGEINETIARLALRHHEKLDGSGYPRGLTGSELTLGERIVAAADIVSALAGTRSYKSVFPKEKIISIISQMKNGGLLDPDTVDVMVRDYDVIMEAAKIRCQPVLDLYTKLQEEYDSLAKFQPVFQSVCIQQATQSPD